MPQFDMPAEQLKTYLGTNPRPDDFDDYWARALEEMRGIDSQLTLERAAFQVDFAECFSLRYTGVGGARLHARYIRPKAVGPHPAVLRFHGYSGSSGDWSEGLAYAALGWSVFSLDCRGQGGLSEDVGGVKGSTWHGHIVRGLDDHPDRLLFRQIFLDVAQLASLAMAMPEVDPTRVGATGASQGGGLALVCAALEPRIKLVAPVYPFLCDYQRVLDLELSNDAYREIRDYFRSFDPNHRRREALFTKLGYIDVAHLAGRVRGRVLFFTGWMDTICPPSSQMAAYNRIRAPKELVVYPDYGHEPMPGREDRILEFFKGL